MTKKQKRMLDALDEMEKDRDGWKCRNENNIKALEETITERDRWKARAEALERAIKKYSKDDIIYKCVCWCCKYLADENVGCGTMSDVCFDEDNFHFVFNEARFADGGDQSE